MNNTQLGPLLYSFFEDQLKCQKGRGSHYPRSQRIRENHSAENLGCLRTAFRREGYIRRDRTGSRQRRGDQAEGDHGIPEDGSPPRLGLR